jgi:hypothetical protein
MIVRKKAKKINKTSNENWEKLVISLKKGFKELERERKTGKSEPLTAVEVVCSHEDIERTRRG